MNKFDLQKLIDDLPAGLDRAILRVLSFHNGRDNAIGREDLVLTINVHHGYKVSERQVRAAISQLRKAGHLIGSAAGTNGGYYLCRDLAEYQEFRESEYAAKINDMLETRAAMDRAAEKQFGKLSPAYQQSLFG